MKNGRGMPYGRFSVFYSIGAFLAAFLIWAAAGWTVSERAILTVYARGPFVFEDGGALQKGQELAGTTMAKEALARRGAWEERREHIRQAKEATQAIEEERGKKEEDEARRASSIISYSQKDYEVLKRIVEAEAGICDTKGRILVANVIINRVKSGQFPDTITDVVYQKSQFSPVGNGSLDSCTVTPETTEAVNRALAGEDYSQGALYFMNRGGSKKSNISWFDQSLTYLFQHDRHEFFK